MSGKQEIEHQVSARAPQSTVGVSHPTTDFLCWPTELMRNQGLFGYLLYQ